MKKAMILGLVLGMGIHSAMAADAGKTIQVTGKDASDLTAALTTLGAHFKTFTDASFMTVTSLNCHEEGAFAYFPMVCGFVDEVTGSKESGDGIALANLLVKLGVPSKEVNEGEFHSSDLSVSKIECTNSALPNLMSCSILLGAPGAYVEHSVFKCTNGEEVNLNLIQISPTQYRAEVTMQSTGDSYPTYVFKNLRAVPHDPRLMGASSVYRGKGIQISANFSIFHAPGSVIAPSIGLDSATKLNCR